MPKGESWGITYVVQSSNPTHQPKWHVREDGWMGASVCLDGPVGTTKKSPLELRYLLHAHVGAANADRATTVFKEFAGRSKFEVFKPMAKHVSWDVRRAG